MTGVAELYADLKVRLLFGIDSHGFFVDPNPVDADGNSLGPEMVIRNVHGTLHGTAVLGPIEVELIG